MNAPYATSIHAVIPCAGIGARAGAAGPKQYALLAGRPLVAHTLDAFLAVGPIQRHVVVLAPSDCDWPLPPSRVELVRQGGETRADSVKAGLSYLLETGADPDDWVLVHDAARCLIQPSDITRLIDACTRDGEGGLLAMPLADTLKQADAEGRVATTVTRAGKWLAQTPQMFRLDALLKALSGDLHGITDEASAMERAGASPLLVEGAVTNFKVTYPGDFGLAEAVLAARAAGLKGST